MSGLRIADHGLRSGRVGRRADCGFSGLILCLLCVVGGFRTVTGSGYTGTAVFPLLKIGQGPRASAMGESFTGLSDDASAVYWNPAGLGQSRQYQFALSHQQWFAGIQDEIAHAVLPLGPGALGLGLLYTGEPNVQYWDDQTLKFGTFRAWSSVLTAGYGVRLSDNYQLGATATGLYEYLRQDHGIGGAVDLGASGHPVPGLGIGVAARHLGSMSFGNGLEPLPMEIAAGATYAIGKFKMTLDAVAPLLDNDPSIRAGVEFSPVSALALRLGYRTGPVDLSGLGLFSGLTGGLGVTVGNIGLDYAFASYGGLGMTHRIGLRTALAPPVSGSQTVIVLDADTRSRLVANLAVTGVMDTTATTDEIRLVPAKPGPLFVTASQTAYEPRTDTFPVTVGTNREDTMPLKRLLSNLTGTICDAKTRLPIGGTIVYSGPTSGELVVAAVPGTFAISGAPAGSYVLNAAGPSTAYGPQSCTLDVPPGQSVNHDFFLIAASIRGTIYDAKTRQPIGGTITYSGPASGTLTVPAVPGTFVIDAPPAGSYVMDAAGPTTAYLPQTCTLDVLSGRTTERDFYLWRKTDFLVLEGVNFETGKADILPMFYPVLDRAGQILKQTPAVKKVELAGHTDPRDINTAEFPSNWELSQARAGAVRTYLITKWGIAPERLVARGYAASQPVASNATAEGMAKNRRTELRIIE
jgi:outer membrane protein OmpA-like peptidoglycan-associated protein